VLSFFEPGGPRKREPRKRPKSASTGRSATTQPRTPSGPSAKSQFLRLCRALHNRKNALFAGHDLGAENWAMIASLVETAKLNAVDPLAWMTDTLTRLVNLWPASRIDEPMPWAFAAARP
jgi:hypothetical protein